MKKKVLISVVLAMILIMSCYATALAKGAFSIAVTQNGQTANGIDPDEPFTVTVTSPQIDLADYEWGAKFVLSFDKGVYQLVDGSVTTNVPGAEGMDMTSTEYSNANGVVEINSSYVSAGMSPGAIVMSADFTAVSTGSGIFSFAVDQMYDENGGSHVSEYGAPDPVTVPVGVVDEGPHILPRVKMTHSVSFTENMQLNYYLPVSYVEGYENVRLKIEKQTYANDGTDNFTYREFILSDFTYDTNSSGVTRYRFYFINISAKELGNEIKAYVMADKDGVTYFTEEPDVYSIKTYAYNRLEKSNDIQFKTLIVDMLNYGSSAQKYFNYNPNLH